MECYGHFYWKEGKIDWHYYALLESLQSDHFLRVGTKLTKEHVILKKRVCLATQLLSKSVADALRFCHTSGVPGFESPDILLTAEFTEIINNLFDILNLVRDLAL